MSEEQRKIIMHALGLTDGKKRAKGYRNYYASGPTPELEEMREAGWLKRYEPMQWLPDYTYCVTKSGLAAAGLTERNVDSEIAARMTE